MDCLQSLQKVLELTLALLLLQIGGFHKLHKVQAILFLDILEQEMHDHHVGE